MKPLQENGGMDHDSDIRKTSKPIAKVEPQKKVVESMSDRKEEREKKRLRRLAEKSESTTTSRKAEDNKRPSSPTKQHDSHRPKSPTKGMHDVSRRPGSPTKDTNRRPSSPTKDINRRPGSPTKSRTDRTSSTSSSRHPRATAISTSAEEPKSPTKVRNTKPEIPQVLKQQSRARSNSNESNSSAASEGRRSPTRKVTGVNSKDSIDSRSSPSGSPKHKPIPREPSARLLALAKPKKSRDVENAKTSDNSNKLTFAAKTPAVSPSRQPKMRMSKEAERRLKASKKAETTVTGQQAGVAQVDDKPSSKERIRSKVAIDDKRKDIPRAEVIPSTVSIEESKPKPVKAEVVPCEDIIKPSTVSVQEQAPKHTEAETVSPVEIIPNAPRPTELEVFTDATDDDSESYKTPPMEMLPQKKLRSESAPMTPSPILSPTQQSPARQQRERSKSHAVFEERQPEDIKKEALCKKDSHLIQMMRARAEKIEKDIEEEEERKRMESQSEDDSSDLSSAVMDIKPELSIPVTHRLRAFQIPSGTKPPKAGSVKSKSPEATSPVSESPTRKSSTSRSSTKSSRSPTTSPTRSPTKSKSPDAMSPIGSPRRTSPPTRSPTISPTESPVRRSHSKSMPEEMQVLPDK